MDGKHFTKECMSLGKWERWSMGSASMCKHWCYMHQSAKRVDSTEKHNVHARFEKSTDPFEPCRQPSQNYTLYPPSTTTSRKSLPSIDSDYNIQKEGVTRFRGMTSSDQECANHKHQGIDQTSKEPSETQDGGAKEHRSDKRILMARTGLKN